MITSSEYVSRAETPVFEGALTASEISIWLHKETSRSLGTVRGHAMWDGSVSPNRVRLIYVLNFELDS